MLAVVLAVKSVFNAKVLLVYGNLDVYSQSDNNRVSLRSVEISEGSSHYAPRTGEKITNDEY